MKMLIAFINIIVSLVCCQACSHNSQIDPEAKKVVNNFYNWYINDAYKNAFDYYQVPPFKKINDSTYSFDKAELSKRLNKIPFISESYKEQLLKKLQVCNERMLEKKWSSEPEPQFNIAECDYLWFDNWVGGQGENINGFNIKSETQINTGIEYIVEITINKKKFTKSKVTIGKENKLYKITNIELIWN